MYLITSILWLAKVLKLNFCMIFGVGKPPCVFLIWISTSLHGKGGLSCTSYYVRNDSIHWNMDFVHPARNWELATISSFLN